MRSTRRRSAPMASASSPRPGTGPRGSWNASTAPSPPSCAATRTGLVGGVQPRRQAHRHRVARTRPRGCGTPTAGASSRSCAATRAGLVGGVQPRWQAHRHRVERQDRAGLGRARAGELAVLRGHEDGCSRRRSAPTASASSPRRWTGPRGCGTRRRRPSSPALRGHEDGVCSAAFSPDGKRIVTASFDRTARVWDADGASRWSFAVTRARSDRAAFSPDGTRIVTGVLG